MKKIKVYDNNTFLVHAWMVTKLGLKTVERDVYAIVYGYSQDEESDFHGSISYISQITGYSRNSVCTALKSLVDKGYLLKEEKVENNIKYCRYRTSGLYASENDEEKKRTSSLYGHTSSLYENKENIKADKKENIIINNNRKSGKKPITKNLYQKCSDSIKALEVSDNLQKLLHEYLGIRLKISDKPIYNVNQWNAILRKLTEELAPNDEDMQISIVKQSIERGYASFFPTNEKKQNSRRRVDKGVSCEQYTQEELAEIKKYQKEVLKNGGRIKF